MDEVFVNQLKQNDALHLETEEYVLYGMGTAFGSQTPVNRFRRLDKATEVWEQVDFPFAGTIGSWTAGNYFGGGSTVKLIPMENELSLTSNVYSFDGEINLVTTMPEALLGSIGHLINNTLYVYSGLRKDRTRNMNILSFDLTSQEWSTSQIANFFFEEETVSWTYEGKAYFLAQDGRIIINDPITNEWSIEGDIYPSTIASDGLAIRNNDKVYVGLFNQRKSIFELDLNTLSWKTKNSYEGSITDVSSAGWVNDDVIYVLKNPVENTPPTVWSFRPEAF